MSSRQNTTWLAAPTSAAACTIIGEVAQAHEGSLGTAHAFIDAIATAGADAVKFQTHIASAESTKAEPWRKKFSPQDETRYDYWKRMEFTPGQWQGLRQHADEKNLMFLSSPFSMQAMDLLDGVGVAGWKVASGEVSNTAMLERMARSGLPMMLSSGMSDMDELDRAVAVIAGRVPLAVLQCESRYPCPPEKIGLNVMAQFASRYPGAAAGLSDHSGKIFAGLAAATLGAQVIEVHATLSRDMFGPDVSSSLTIAELGLLVEGVRFIETMVSSPLDKAALAHDIAPLRAIFMKSLVAADELTAGHVLRESDLLPKKPGGGIAAAELARLVGRTLLRGVKRDEQIKWSDIS